jgi:exonuclease VII small subunit
MSLEENIVLLQSNCNELIQPHNFEKLIKLYQDSINVLNQSKINLKSLEEKTKKIPKSRKKINIEQIIDILEQNCEQFQDKSLPIESKVELFRNSMSMINLARDKLEQQEIKINYHD